MHRKTIHVLTYCLLTQLFVCLNVDAERIESNSGATEHKHRRRSTKNDPRHIGFRFNMEPTSTIASPSAIFHCTYQFDSDSLGDGAHSSGEESDPNLDVRIEWRKDGAPINHVRSGTGRITTLSNGSLLIEDVTPSDEGFYQCAVIYSMPNSYHIGPAPINPSPWIFLSKRASLALPTLQRFEQQPINQKVFLNQFVAFRCLLDSKPPALIEWYKNNRKLEHGEPGLTILPVSQTLQIEATQLTHSGTYKCIARNGAKSRTSQVAALEIVEGSSDIGAISVVLEPRNQLIEAGRDFILECLVNGNPKPRARWLHESSTIDASSSGGRIEFVGAANSSLLIRSAQVSDSGVYTCRAENGDDSVDSSATISVKSPPTISAAPKDIFTQETADAEFECHVEGMPRPRMTWFKNGEIIVPSEYFVIGSNKLKIFGLVRDDQGIYQCFAENEVGSAQAAAQLIVDPAATHLALTADGSPVESQTPLQPLGLKAIDVGSQSISLKWDPPLNQGNGDVRMYHVFFREEESTRERTVNSTTTSSTITSLSPNSVYVIRVVGVNHAGTGKSSEPIRITTRQGEMGPGRVRNLKADVTGSDAIKVDWDPPADTLLTSDPVRYKLFYAKGNATEEEKETQVLMVKTSYTLHSMDKNTRYLIRIQAERQNLAGLWVPGQTSDQLEVRTYSDKPSAPPQNVRVETSGHNSIVVHWNPPPDEDQNGIVTGYKIRYKTKKRGAKGNSVDVDGDPGSYQIEGLEGGAHYTVRIAAMTHNGTGPFSDWFGVDIAPDEREETQIAGAPSELRVHAGHDSIQVAWSPPRDESVMIRGYQVGWGVNIPDVEKADVDTNSRQFIITGLKPNREYVISLRATAAYGYTSFSNPNILMGGTESKIPHIAQMSAPVGVSAEAISSTSIRVSWSDPNDGFNQYYTVKWSSSVDNNGQIRQMNTSETEQIIESLRPNTQYEFSVKLVESQQWSMSAVNKTLPAPPSSAPRDLTIISQSASAHDDPNTVMLSWQPPKYANGEIEEYIILYSDRLDLSDKDWIMDSIKGDRLSMLVKNLLPKATYYFKIQARNVKGYGPFSPVATYTPDNNGIRVGSFDPIDSKSRNDGPHWRVSSSSGGFYAQLKQLLSTNLIYVLIGVVSVVLLLLVVILTVRRRSQQSYTQGRKSSRGGTQPDLWIQQNGSRFAALNAQTGISAVDFGENPTPGYVTDMKRFGVGAAESPPPRYQTLQETGMSQSQTSYLSESCAYASHRLVRNSPLTRNCQQRKSLPPGHRISTSATPTMGADRMSSSVYGNLEVPTQKPKMVKIQAPPRRDSAEANCQKAYSGHEADRRKVSNTSFGNETVFDGPNKQATRSEQSPKKSSFQGVGIPTVAVVASAVRRSTNATNLKQFGSGPQGIMKTSSPQKTVYFSPEIEDFIDEEGEKPMNQAKQIMGKRCAKAGEMREGSATCHSDSETCNGTLGRSYHQSSVSLEARQRTPQLLYAGVNRQPIQRVDLAVAGSSDHGSYAGSNTRIDQTSGLHHTPPPPPPPMPTSQPEYQSASSSAQLHDGYQTVRGLNPLKSFAQMGGVHSPLLPGNNVGEHRTAHVVRPVVFASPTLRNSAAMNRPAGIVIGQKSSVSGAKLPVGRATAQPRVNISSYSPYSTVRVARDEENGENSGGKEKNFMNGDRAQFDSSDEMKPLRGAPSAEDINSHEIDQMIDTLQQLQQEFTER
ncbi:fibronectin type III domain-containing protein [Ditylenchus destructor]|nr:fibronectin type III domain-containing protein [Ditylenchus destructor]